MNKKNKESIIDIEELLSKNRTEDTTEEVEEKKEIIQTPVLSLEMKTKSSDIKDEEFTKGKPYRYVIRARVTND